MEGDPPLRRRHQPRRAPSRPCSSTATATGGCSVTGGFVYRGAAIPALDGAYLFADYCAGQLRALRVADGQVVDEHTFEASGASLVSFGTDAAGEVYVLSLGGGIFRLDAA